MVAVLNSIFSISRASMHSVFSRSMLGKDVAVMKSPMALTSAWTQWRPMFARAALWSVFGACCLLVGGFQATAAAELANKPTPNEPTPSKPRLSTPAPSVRIRPAEPASGRTSSRLGFPESPASPFDFRLPKQPEALSLQDLLREPIAEKAATSIPRLVPGKRRSPQLQFAPSARKIVAAPSVLRAERATPSA